MSGDTGQQQRRDGDARGDGGLAAAEVVVVPVSDVDRAKGCYDGLGWPLDADAGGAEYHVPIRTARRRPASTELYLRETASRAGSVQLVRATSSRHAATPLKPSAKKEMRCLHLLNCVQKRANSELLLRASSSSDRRGSPS
jgi:hypothetical protein